MSNTLYSVEVLSTTFLPTLMGGTLAVVEVEGTWHDSGETARWEARIQQPTGVNGPLYVLAAGEWHRVDMGTEYGSTLNREWVEAFYADSAY